jgi:hypothetical protein
MAEDHRMNKAFVFLSCGQRDDERQYAKQIEEMIREEFGLDCYNAESWQGFDDVMSITEQLAKADYYLFVDFKRNGAVPISVFTHQEFALARAWQITEMLAFQEEGLESHGMLGYVQAHPTRFKRHNLMEIVRSKVTEKKWRADYSRNLVASAIVVPDAALPYGDHHGGNVEKIWKVRIENRRKDRAALNTIAILESTKELATGLLTSPDKTFLKWAGQQAYQKTILPEDFGEIDAFSERVNQPGIWLHSALDLYPRKPIATHLGKYELKYLLYADTFPKTSCTLELHYDGGLVSNVQLLR